VIKVKVTQRAKGDKSRFIKESKLKEYPQRVRYLKGFKRVLYRLKLHFK
jgi:hypothetical protein